MVAVVILGNKNNDDGTMSPLTRQRLQLALPLVNKAIADIVILCGGMANPIANITESQVMYDYLVQQGVNNTLLIQEDKSMTTKENAQYTALLLHDYPLVDQIILVTTPEHMNRTFLNPIKLFKKYLPKNIKIIPHSNIGEYNHD